MSVASEPDELENVLRQVFLECDPSLASSITYTTLCSDDEVPISRVLHCVQKQLPTWSVEHMLILWEYLNNFSTNDCINLRQFKEATRCWIAKVSQNRTQDDNNNIEKEPYKSLNDTTMDSMQVDMNKSIEEVELRGRLRKFDEDNIFLREELARAEESITNLERQCKSLENQLDRHMKKCQQLEKENDEQKDKLDEIMKNERNYVSAYQRSTRQYESLSKQFEAAEIQIQGIQPLKEEMEKISKERTDCVKQIAKLEEEFCKKEEECEKLTVITTELQKTISDMRETYEYTIRNLQDLREKNFQLTGENMELQSLSALQSEKFLLSPDPNIDVECYSHNISYKLEKVSLEDSLYAELRTSGFTAECSGRDSCQLELEERLDYYDTVISVTLEQLEKILQNLTNPSSDSIDTLHPDLPRVEDTIAYNIEALKHKVALLLNTVNEKIARSRDTRDSSTQLRADDSSGAIGSSGQFGITSFRAQLARAQQCPKPETDLWSSIDALRDSSHNNKEDPFLKVIRSRENGLDCNIVDIIDPLIEELDRIIEETINSPAARKDLPASGNPRYRSICTLPSNSQVPSAEEKNTSQESSYQSPRRNSPARISLFASGDGLSNCGEKPAESKTRSTMCDGSHQEDPSGSIASEMPRELSTLEMDFKAQLSSTETSSAKNFQAPEVTVTSPQTSPLTSPRRKFSVYYRSFDVVEVRDPISEDDGGLCLEVRRSSSNSSIPDNEKSTAPSSDGKTAGNEMTADDDVCFQNGTPRYPFNSYRNVMNDSDSSNSCSPQKQLWDDEQSPTVPSVLRKICLAPTRLKLSRKSEPDKTTNGLDTKKSTGDCASSATDSSEPDALSFFTVVDGAKREEDDNDLASLHSSSTLVPDKCETVANAMILESLPRGHLTSSSTSPHNQNDPTKIADPEDPHSMTSNERNADGDQPRVERSVDSQMSSREDTSTGQDSEYESARKPSDRYIEEKKIAMGASEAEETADVLPLITDSPMKMPCENDGKTRDRNLLDAKQERRQRHLTLRRSFSEGDNDRALCRYRRQNGSQTAPSTQTDQFSSFPSLTCARLQESGIANLPDMEINSRESLTDFELQKRYIAFSLGLSTDRVTMPRRMEASLRQRDQSERNLDCEVQKMQQDIQELAPLCTDRESVERVERVRHQLDVVARCAHRVSRAAETLGAVHQEHRVSRAVFLADRYLQLLQSRCEKLAANVAETKQILMENNIVVEESSGELGDDLPRIRYRSGTPANNRMMMARRRASIATMSRPMGSTQDVTKDTVKQRNSVSGRMTLRRPSLSYETSKWENERLSRTDSSSFGELRGIFEYAESRRGSKEENNNMLRLSQSNNQNLINCAIIDDEIWIDPKQEVCPDLAVDEDVDRDCEPYERSSQSFRLKRIDVSWRTMCHLMLWSILIFFLGFYVNVVLSEVNTCGINDPSNERLNEFLKKYFQPRNVMPFAT